MSNNVLNKLDTDDVLKAFYISLCRMVAEDPNLLLELDETHKSPEWKKLFDKLQDKEERRRFSEIINNDATSYNWQKIEETFCLWGEYGWITDHSIVPFRFWELRPKSQLDADRAAMRSLNNEKFSELKNELLEITSNRQFYNEAINCFNNKCYAACAVLLVALIDGELIRCKRSNTLENKKTGLIAGTRVIDGVTKNDMYGLSGFFHLELLNYKAYINTLFEKANGFKSEPNCINRNYLNHGMSRRKVLRKDCIKLMIAYRRTIFYARNFDN